MSQPSETAIAEVCEFASLDLVRDRALVISALRAKNGSIQDVVLSYYDDPLKFRQLYTWDETSFMGDRDTFNGRRLPSLNIQDSDYNGSNYLPVIRGVSPSNIHTAAPSRPPSRAQSPLSGLAEWNSSNAGHTSNISQEDKELQQALAESSAMSSMHAPPGVGSISNPHAPIGPQLPTHLPYFGSADRETYDPNQWAMVRRTLEPEEPGPSGRIRAEDAPAFLRSRQSGYGASTLGALLTILHAIPLARNSFLTAGVQPASYGQNSAWWKGASITPTGAQEPDQTMRLETIINADSDEDGIYERQSVRPEIARELTDEIHRLMAFLDSTARAYATADRIADSRIVQDCHGTDTNQKLFEAIQRLALPGLQQTFYSDVQLLAFGDLSSPSRCESYAILDLKVDTLNVLSGQSSAPGDLYSVMDNLYWENFNPLSDQQQVSLADTNMAVISRLAPVQILQLNASSTQHINEFDIPSVLYLDRYLDENKSLIADLQLQLQKVYKALQRVDEAIYETKNYIDQSGPDQPMIRDRVTLSEQAISFAFQKEWHLKAQSSWERYIALQSANKDTSTDTSGHEFDFSIADIDLVQTLTEDERNNRRSVQAEIAIHLRKLRSIRKKITKLNAEKNALYELALHLQRKYTVPKATEHWSPTHEYVLRGVVVSPTKFYFCRRQNSAPQTHGIPELVKPSNATEKEPASISCQAGCAETHKEAKSEFSQNEDEEKVTIPDNTEEKDIKGAKMLPNPASSSAMDQWWMVAYDTQDSVPFTLVKSTVELARAAAFGESKVLTLVYAKTSTLDEENVPLSSPLENFVRFDNRFFKQELKDDSTRVERKRMPAEEALPTSPLKRHQRHRSASIDSMASNMASLGSKSSYDLGGERGEYVADMDLDDEDQPLLNRGNDWPYPPNTGEPLHDVNYGPSSANNTVYNWMPSKPLGDKAGTDQQHFADGSNTSSTRAESAATVLPQREIDTPAFYGDTDIKSAHEPLRAVSADMTDTFTAEA